MGRAALGLVAATCILASAASAQAPTAPSPWTIGFSTGAYFPASALIKATDSNTELSAGPAFSFEGQYLVASSAAIYANGTLGLGSVRLGSSIQPEVTGPSTQVTLLVGTAGVLLAPDWWGGTVEPTLRLGGGLKWYGFDLTGAENQLRPTGEIGLGLRSAGSGTVQVGGEVRYLPSSFDQSKLPTRGIATQEQQQNDFVFSVWVGIRP